MGPAIAPSSVKSFFSIKHIAIYLTMLSSFLPVGAALLSTQIQLAVGNAILTFSAPTANLTNGTYYGLHSSFYNEDWFLGIPYAQPPVETLRYAAPQPLNTTWPSPRNATQYGPECVGYGVCSHL
jgi:hypothetical protein